MLNDAWKGENLGLLKQPKLPCAWTPSCKVQYADAHWEMAYSHKTQSIMKNGDQQKCFDKALLITDFQICGEWLVIKQEIKKINALLLENFRFSLATIFFEFFDLEPEYIYKLFLAT